METIELLARQFPGAAMISVKDAARATGLAAGSIYSGESEGKPIIPSVLVGARRLIRLVDLAVFIDSRAGGMVKKDAEPEQQPQQPAAAPLRRRRGRPSNAERAARAVAIAGRGSHDTGETEIISGSPPPRDRP